eukprot:7518387-Alexandrium_andersonii.AAC.1
MVQTAQHSAAQCKGALLVVCCWWFVSAREPQVGQPGCQVGQPGLKLGQISYLLSERLARVYLF